MDLDTQFKIKNTKNYYNYLKENSYWYKHINRNKEELKNFDRFVREKYGLNMSSRLNKTMDNIELITSLIDMIK